jgi:hypothetical protein
MPCSIECIVQILFQNHRQNPSSNDRQINSFQHLHQRKVTDAAALKNNYDQQLSRTALPFERPHNIYSESYLQDLRENFITAQQALKATKWRRREGGSRNCQAVWMRAGSLLKGIEGRSVNSDWFWHLMTFGTNFILAFC